MEIFFIFLPKPKNLTPKLTVSEIPLFLNRRKRRKKPEINALLFQKEETEINTCTMKSFT